jgi:hypothetical protein
VKYLFILLLTGSFCNARNIKRFPEKPVPAQCLSRSQKAYNEAEEQTIKNVDREIDTASYMGRTSATITVDPAFLEMVKTYLTNGDFHFRVTAIDKEWATLVVTWAPEQETK